MTHKIIDMVNMVMVGMIMGLAAAVAMWLVFLLIVNTW